MRKFLIVLIPVIIIILVIVIYNPNLVMRNTPGLKPAIPLPKKPMPPEILDDTDAYDWGIGFHTFNDNQPPQPMGANFKLWYWGEERELVAGGSDDTDPWQSYRYDFPSIRPFQDILDYIKENKGSFFDHSEFIDAIPGWYKIPTSEEWFALSAGNSDTNVAGYEYVIVIEYPDDPPVSDEIAWVFDRLRELRDEVLVHPQFNRFEPMPFELLKDIFNYNWSLSFRTFYNDDPTCPMSISLFFLDKGDEGYEVTASADTFVCSRERYHYDFPSIQEFEDILVYIRENSEFFFDYSEFEGADPDRYIQPESDEYFILSAYNSKSRGINVSNLISTEFTDDPPVPDEVAWVFDRLRELRDEILLHPQE